jgi:hypothetical protein
MNITLPVVELLGLPTGRGRLTDERHVLLAADLLQQPSALDLAALRPPARVQRVAIDLAVAGAFVIAGVVSVLLGPALGRSLAHDDAPPSTSI